MHRLLDLLHDAARGRFPAADGAVTMLPLFAAVSPGNARSPRSFLAECFVPLGSEVVVTPPTAAPGR